MTVATACVCNAIMGQKHDRGCPAAFEDRPRADCRSCGAPAEVFVQVRPSPRVWTVPDPVCGACAERVRSTMQIPVRISPLFDQAGVA